MADWRRSLVDVTVVTDAGGMRLGTGAIVDLDTPVGSVRLRDCVDPLWFAPIDEHVAPSRLRRRAVSNTEDTNVD